MTHNSSAWPSFASLPCKFAILSLITALTLLTLTGCRDDLSKVRQIQAQRQERIQAESQQDHLGEAFSLLSHLVELNPEKARRQIAYHLNRWAGDKPFPEAAAPALIETVDDVLPPSVAKERIMRESFLPSDIDHLRDAYLTRQIVEWIDHPRSDDPLLKEWMKEMEKQLGSEETLKLRRAARIFDWTVRNIAYEPKEPGEGAPNAPEFSGGMKFQGAGYRQTDYQALWRGMGDSLQRSGVFTLLCRQASVPAVVLAVPDPETGELNEWCAGALVGGEIYLFEFELGTYVPGPDQVGIATLAQARTDPAVMRRLNVPGFFDYPLDDGDVQQCVALMNLVPEAVSPRMKLLESGLTGDRRMNVYVDADALAKQIDAASGIAGVRMWDIPLLAERYAAELKKAVDRDPLVMFWYMSRYAIFDTSESTLSMARWRHLHGQFDNDDDENREGARSLYLAQRAPEFEIEDLRIDVELQRAYDVRRQLGMDAEAYDRQIQQTQAMMRLAKRTATYWISLIQYDDQRYDTAETWLSKRVLDPEQLSFWEPAARYNLARSVERLGEIDRAIELYKTDDDPQEHGNRIRARLVDKTIDEDVESE